MSFAIHPPAPVPGAPAAQASPQSTPLAAGHQRVTSPTMTPPSLGMAAASHIAAPRVDDAGVPLRHVEQQPLDLSGRPVTVTDTQSGNPLTAIDPTGPVDVRQLDLSAAAGWGQQGMHAAPSGAIGVPADGPVGTGYGVAPLVSPVRPHGPVVAPCPGGER